MTLMNLYFPFIPFSRAVGDVRLLIRLQLLRICGRMGVLRLGRRTTVLLRRPPGHRYRIILPLPMRLNLLQWH